MKAPFVRSPYNYDVEKASDEVAVGAGGPSLTVQSMAEDADINVLMRRYGILQNMPLAGARVPEFGDFSEVDDFQSALNAVIAAEDNFMLLPAEVRAKCQNSPQMFMQFCADPANLPELRRLGLAKEEIKPPEPPPPKP